MNIQLQRRPGTTTIDLTTDHDKTNHARYPVMRWEDVRLLYLVLRSVNPSMPSWTQVEAGLEQQWQALNQQRRAA